MRFHPGAYFLELERLGYVVHRAHVEGPHFVQGFAQGRQEQHGDLAQLVVLLQAPTDLVAVHLRHHDVEEDEIRWLTGSGLERQPAVGHGAYLVALLLEQLE